MVSCNPPSESSSTPAKPGGIDTGAEIDTGNNDVKGRKKADVFPSGQKTYYIVDTAKAVQIKPSHIGSNIKGDVSWAVTKVGKSGEVGHIADIRKLEANAVTANAGTGDANKLEIPQNTVGFFEVEVF